MLFFGKAHVSGRKSGSSFNEQFVSCLHRKFKVQQLFLQQKGTIFCIASIKAANASKLSQIDHTALVVR